MNKNTDKKSETEWIKLIINGVFGIILPIVFFIGGFYFYKDQDSIIEIIKNISFFIYFLPIILLIAGFIFIVNFRLFLKLSISFISIIGLFGLITGFLIIRNSDLLLDNEKYISTKVSEIIREFPTQTPLSVYVPAQNNEVDITPTSIAMIKEDLIVEFINTVNKKISKGLSDTKKYKDDVYEYFCSATPNAKSQINTFFWGIIRKYRGYAEKDIYLPNEFEVEKIVQHPIEIAKGEFTFSQIETWTYTLYPGEKNEREDKNTSLYKYSIIEIKDSIFCISNYEIEKPPEDYYIGLEEINN